MSPGAGKLADRGTRHVSRERPGRKALADGFVLAASRAELCKRIRSVLSNRLAIVYFQNEVTLVGRPAYVKWPADRAVRAARLRGAR